MNIRRLTFLVLFAAVIFGSQLHAKVVEKIVAIVNDEIVTFSEVKKYKQRLKTGGLVDDALLKTTDPKKLLRSQKALINHLIDEKVLDSEVKRNGLSVTVERVEKEIRSITSRNKISRANLKKALREKGVSFSEYQDFIKTSIERNSLIEKAVTSKIKISDEDIGAYYVGSQGNNASNIFEYQIAHILFLPKNGGEAAAKERAGKTLKKIKQKASFDKLASQFSEDPNFTQGGILGTFKAGEMLKEMEGAVKGLNVGDTSGIVKTRAGFHIFKVLKKTLVSNPDYEKNKERIRQTLFAQSFKVQFRNWLDERRREAFIRIN